MLAATAGVLAAGGVLALGRHRRTRSVWKFGYGSNMSSEHLRNKKNLDPLASHRTVLRGYRLSFPEGFGIDFVEPAFATLVRDPDGEVHGVCTLFSAEDAQKLDKMERVGQERGYVVAEADVEIYDGGGRLRAEVYEHRNIAAGHPEGVCSTRYRDILVAGARENGLDAAWIAKLEALPTYAPSAATLARRGTLPPISSLPVMTRAELAKHDGRDKSRSILVSSCGYIFEHEPFISAFRGRDITHRNALHRRGVNLDANDDATVMARLSDLSADEREYCLCYRDRLLARSGRPTHVLREFWEAQEREAPPLFTGNVLSKL